MPPLRGVGLFDSADFDPGAWKPDSPAYVPFLTADRVDKFWAAKIMMRLTPADIRAIVETGRYSDPRATEYVTATLIARQRATARYWFERTNPIDHVAASDSGMCFDDLMLAYGLDDTATHYTISTYGRDERLLSRFSLAAGANGHTCTQPLVLGGGTDAYTIVELATTRGDFSGRTFVHVARDPATHAPRVIGIWRP